jgi:hypothetical protein
MRSPLRISDSSVTDVRPTAATRENTAYGSGPAYSPEIGAQWQAQYDAYRPV